MSNNNNTPTVELIGYSTMEMKGLVTEEDIEGSDWMQLMNASTIAGATPIPPGEIRKGELSANEIERVIKGISTKARFYICSKDKFIEDITRTKRVSVHRRSPVWMEDDTIHINLDETKPGQFHLIQYEGETYLVGVTQNNKLQMYLLPEATNERG